MAEKPVNETTAALRAMSPQLSFALMGAYAAATGMPTHGLHWKFMGHAVKRFAVPCDSCKGTGLQVCERTPGLCVDCGGFKSRLSPAAVRRLYQIVAARFPEVRLRSNAEEAARRWEGRKVVNVTKPMYLAHENLPLSVPQRPDSSALLVASITWRRGLRSEFLWTANEGNICVLWERLPDLAHTGEAWTEVFAWAQRGDRNPERSAQRLFQQGLAMTNPAYEWLYSLGGASSTGLRKVLTTTQAGLLSEHQVEWLFRTAARIRRKAAAALTASVIHNRPVAKVLNIGPYPFGRGTSNPRQEKSEAAHAPSIVGAVPVKTTVGEAQVLPLHRAGTIVRSSGRELI